MVIITLTKLSGFLYSAIVASRLGADRPLDMFLLANTIPEIIGNLILIGVISAVFIPVLIKAQTNHGEKRFLKLFNTLLNTCLIFFILSSVFLAFTAEWTFPYILNNLIKPNEIYTDTDLSEIVRMLRLLFIPQIILGISTFYSSALNVHHRFLVPQLAPFFYNFGRIIGAYFLVPLVGGVEGLVWGTILGALLHLVIQFPLVRNIGVKHKAEIDLSDEYAIEAFKFGLPRMIGLGAEYIANGIDKFIAARFVIGSVSAMDYAVRLVSLPLSLIGLTFSTASFPTLSRLFQEGKVNEFRELFIQLLNQVFFLAVPMTVALLVLRVSLVRLMFGIFGGEFDFEDTYLTAWVVAFFAIGLALESLRSLIYRAFYAANDTIRPLYSAIFTVVLGVITGILFTNYFSHFEEFSFDTFFSGIKYFFESSNGKAAVGGLALSSSLVYTLEFFILMFMFNKYVCHLDFKTLKRKFLKKIVAGFIMGLVMYSYFKLWGDSIFQEKTFILLVLVGSTLTIGLVAYMWTAYVLSIQEFSLFLVFAKKILPKQISDFFKEIRDRFE